MPAKNSTTKRILTAAAFFVLTVAFFFLTVQPEKVPGLVEKHPVVAKIYDKRDALLKRDVTAEKTDTKQARKLVAKRTAGAGYSKKDRKKMDELTSWGSQDY
jgi:hypothetical protein